MRVMLSTVRRCLMFSPSAGQLQQDTVAGVTPRDVLMSVPTALDMSGVNASASGPLESVKTQVTLNEYNDGATTI